MFRRRRRVTEQEAAPAPRGRYVQDEVVTPPPRRPLLWPWLLLLLALVIGGIAAAYFLTRDDGGSASKPRVPNVVGMSTSAAIQQLGQRGYPAIVKGRVSTGARLGTVLSQAPTAGTELDRSQQVTIIVARGPSTVEVPNVVGLSAVQALVRLQAANLKGRNVQIQSVQPKGRVIRQAPAGGSQAEKDSTVVLTVSKGSKPVTLPSVTGLTEAAATATLTRLGLRLSVSRISSTEPKGIVIAQQPVAGSRAQRGSIVGLDVSTGPSTTGSTARGVVVPEVVGMGQRDALVRLERARFEVDSSPVASSRPRGAVVAQQPAGGARAAPRSRVRLQVSLGPGQRPERTVPDTVDQDESAARRALVSAGFTVRTVDRPVTDPSQEGVVVNQKPVGGDPAPAGSQVVIYVGRASA
jgi:eukaryotic-like serine/threonine-protein kinase